MLHILLITIPFVLLFIQIQRFHHLCEYVAKKYPKEWFELAPDSAEEHHEHQAKTAFQTSLTSGFFSNVQDPRIHRFKQFKQINLLGSIALLAMALVMAIYD